MSFRPIIKTVSQMTLTLIAYKSKEWCQLIDYKQGLSMDPQIFECVRCVQGKKVAKVCLNKACQLCPFLCQEQCTCTVQHGIECVIRSIKELNDDIRTVLRMEFFMVYSSKFKGESIFIAGRYATQTLSPPLNQRFALTYDPIPLNGSETLTFRLSKIKGCVGVGVMLRQVMQSYDYCYQPDGDYMGHGAYMLLSNSMLYSHSDPRHNGTTLNKIALKQKDVVKVRYTPGKVTFIVRFIEHTIPVPVDDKQHLHFGVYLYDAEDEIEIVNTFVDTASV